MRATKRIRSVVFVLFITLGLLLGVPKLANEYVATSDPFPSVKNANLIGTNTLNPQFITELSSTGTVLFAGTTSSSGTELWKSDGTEAGTSLVKDIVAGSASSNPHHLIQFNNKIIFISDDEIWSTDGTANGTSMVYRAPAAISEVIKSGTFIYFISGYTAYISNLTNTSVAASLPTSGAAKPSSLIPDGLNGVFFKGYTACSIYSQVLCYMPIRIQPATWPTYLPPIKSDVKPPGASTWQCAAADDIIFNAAANGNLSFRCNSGAASTPHTNYWFYNANLGYAGEVATSNIPADFLAHPAKMKYLSSWNAATSQYDSREHSFVNSGTFFYAFDKPADGVLSYANLDFKEYKLDMSTGQITVARNQLKDSCGSAYPVAERLIGGIRYYLGRPGNCSFPILAGGIFKISSSDGALTYITDIDTPDGPYLKFRAFFNALTNGGRISAVQTSSKIFYNNAGSLEVTSLGADECPNSTTKTAPGICGCDTEDTDSDSDGTPDCNDLCFDDPYKTNPGICGCGSQDTDSDADNTADCMDGCMDDPEKIDPGACGCGVSDIDANGDGTADCNDIPTPTPQPTAQPTATPLPTATPTPLPTATPLPALGVIQGRVIEQNGTAVKGVLVQAGVLGYTTTDDNGYYQFNSAATLTTYELTFRRDGLTFNTPTLNITTGATFGAFVPDVVVTANRYNGLACTSKDYSSNINSLSNSTRKLRELGTKGALDIALLPKVNSKAKKALSTSTASLQRLANKNFSLSKKLTQVSYSCQGTSCTSVDHKKTLDTFKANANSMLNENLKIVSQWKSVANGKTSGATRLEKTARAEHTRLIKALGSYPTKVKNCF